MAAKNHGMAPNKPRSGKPKRKEVVLVTVTTNINGRRSSREERCKRAQVLEGSRLHYELRSQPGVGYVAPKGTWRTV